MCGSGSTDDEALPAALWEVLRSAQALGAIGAAPIEVTVTHARRYAAVLADLGPGGRVLDLGSGAGIPGLVIAAERPLCHVVLLDGRERRADDLRRVVARLGWEGRVEVLWARAEVAGRDTRWRGTFDAVTARGFGSAGVTAEAAAPFLRVGGRLLVSEPPGGSSRWPAPELALLGLVQEASGDAALAAFRLVGPCPDRFPRRQLKPPLF